MNATTSGVSPLRQRMLDDMRMRKLDAKTQSAYIRAVRRLTMFIGRSPDTANIEDLRRFQLSLVDQNVPPPDDQRDPHGTAVLLRVHPRPSRDHDQGVPGACGAHTSSGAQSRGSRAPHRGDALADAGHFAAWLAPLRRCARVVYAKRPFAGPAAVLAYLSRYTHRVAISNSRLIALDERGVTFRWKDHRAHGSTRHKVMTLDAGEFMRRFLLHVLPAGFLRIRHYGLLANGTRQTRLALARQLLEPRDIDAPPSGNTDPVRIEVAPTFVCRHCGAAMLIIDTFVRGEPIRAPPSIDTT